MRTLRKNTLALSGVAALIALSATACGSSATTASTTGTGTSASTAPSSAAPSDAATTAAAADAPFGSGCAAVPADGKGSFSGMQQDAVATAASNNPVLSTLVTAVTAAKLGDTLNSAKDITVFAPANSAFEAMDQATLKAALADPSGLLTKVLTYHVIGQRLSPDKLAGTFPTLNGADLTIKGSGTDFTVGAKDAKVVCGNVQTANATVYIIDQVLMPPA